MINPTVIHLTPFVLSPSKGVPYYWASTKPVLSQHRSFNPVRPELVEGSCYATGLRQAQPERSVGLSERYCVLSPSKDSARTNGWVTTMGL
jgi:hypothetical protein